MVNHNSNSSKTNDTRDLARTRRPRAKDFLLRLANLSDADDAYEEFRSRFPFVVDERSKNLARHWAMNIDEDYDPDSPDELLARQNWLLPLRDSLRDLWCKDLETKQWGMFRISQDFFQQGNRGVIHTPLATSSDFWLAQLRPCNQTERLLREFTKLGDHTQKCLNDKCTRPYFIASRRGRKFCSEPCAKPAQREAKRKYWQKTGKHRRADSDRHAL